MDAHVGKHIFHKCILGMLRDNGKTVILPCHALSFLRFADHIVSLKDNVIDEQGTYKDLVSAGGDFQALMEIHSSTAAEEEQEEETPEAEAESEEKDEEKQEAAPATPKKSDGKLIKDEERAKGTVDKSIFVFYLKQVGISQVIYVFF